MKSVTLKNGTICLVGHDIWEGIVDFEPAEFELAGIAFLLIRINELIGKLDMDDNFQKFWNKCKNRAFLRGIYFVVDPGQTAQAMFDWIIANWPSDAPHCIFLDVEVRGLEAGKYSSKVRSLINLLKNAGWLVRIYTGAGYDTMLDPWPTADPYWWSAYPFSIEPSKVCYKVSWDQLWTKLAELSWPPYNHDHCKGLIMMWQVADVVIVPGCPDHAMDINIFPGTPQQLAQFMGYEGFVMPVTSILNKFGTYIASGFAPYIRPGGPGESFIAGPVRLKKGQKINISALSADGNWGFATAISPDKFDAGWVNMAGLAKTDDDPSWTQGTVPVIDATPIAASTQEWMQKVDTYLRTLPTPYSGPKPPTI